MEQILIGPVTLGCIMIPHPPHNTTQPTCKVQQLTSGLVTVAAGTLRVGRVFAAVEGVVSLVSAPDCSSTLCPPDVITAIFHKQS